MRLAVVASYLQSCSLILVVAWPFRRTIAAELSGEAEGKLQFYGVWMPCVDRQLSSSNQSAAAHATISTAIELAAEYAMGAGVFPSALVDFAVPNKSSCAKGNARGECSGYWMRALTSSTLPQHLAESRRRVGVAMRLGEGDEYTAVSHLARHLGLLVVSLSSGVGKLIGGGRSWPHATEQERAQMESLQTRRDETHSSVSLLPSAATRANLLAATIQSFGWRSNIHLLQDAEPCASGVKVRALSLAFRSQ